MQKRQHGLVESSLPVGELARNAQGWLLDGEVRQLSPNTLAARKNVVEKLLWFLRQRELEQCGTPELRAFLAAMWTTLLDSCVCTIYHDIPGDFVMHSTCPVYTIHLPEYRIAPDTDWLACGRKLDRLIETHFPGRRLAMRAIGLTDHPGKSLDELVAIIQQLGTDRYDPERAGLYYAREGRDDIHAGTLLVTEDGLRAEKHVQMSPLAETLEIFYEGTLADRGYSIRLDLLLFYDLDQLAPVYDMPPESCYEFAFMHPDRKPEALVGLIRILR